MEGLEISESKLSELEYSGRLDAEYYRPQFMKYERLLQARSAVKLASLSDFLIGPFGSAFAVENYSDESIYRYIRGKDVKEMYLMDNDNVYMPKSDFDRLSKYALRKNDILVSVVGTLGNAAIVEEEDLPAVFSCKSTVLRANSIYPEYLLAYLNSKYGRSLLLRKERGAIQKGLNLDDLKTLAVYSAGTDFQKDIRQIYLGSLELRKSSKIMYSQAEAVLAETLDISGFQPSTESVSVKSYAESFAQTGRLDAEYYQPKYDGLIAHLVAQPHDKLINLVDIKKSIEPGSDAYSDDDTGLPFLRVADYSKHGLLEPQKRLADSYVEANKAEILSLLPRKKTILFSKDGSVGEAYCLQEDGNFITSGAILHLTVKPKKEVLPDYLALVLNSDVVRLQAERDAGGSIILHWRKEEIEDVIVPIISSEKQEAIVKSLKEAEQLKFESKRLLDVAKRAVEIAIEQDEAAAISYIMAQGVAA